jgi:hypothetical protein
LGEQFFDPNFVWHDRIFDRVSGSRIERDNQGVESSSQVFIGDDLFKELQCVDVNRSRASSIELVASNSDSVDAFEYQSMQ